VFYLTETKPQTWRALVVFEDGTECLLYLGRSTTQVRAGYRDAYMELLDEEERSQVHKINLQCWEGAPDRGRWINKTTLSIPDRVKVATLENAPARVGAGLGLGAVRPAADRGRERILPFRRPVADSATPQPEVEQPEVATPTAI